MIDELATSSVRSAPASGSLFTDGALSYVEELKGILEQTAAVCARSFSDAGKPTSIKVEWAKDSEFNASASLTAPDRRAGAKMLGGAYRVTFNEGLLIKLIYAFELVLTIAARTRNRTAYSRVKLYGGDAERRHYVVSSEFIDMDLQRQLVDAMVEPFSSRELCRLIEESFWPFQLARRGVDDVTRQYVLFAAHFLMLHECSHIGRGHLESIGDTLGARCLSELHASDAGSIGNGARQSIEHDADTQAILNLILNYLPRDGEELPAFLEVLTASLTLLFSLFDLSIRSLASYDAMEHPDPDVRIYAATMYASVVYGEVWGDERSTSAATFSDLIHVALFESAGSVVKALVEMGVIGGGTQKLFAEDREPLMAVITELFDRSLAAQEQWTHRVSRTSSRASR